MASKFGTWWQKSRHRSWWMKIQQHPFVTMGIILLIVLIIAVVLSNGIGFNEYAVKSTATETTLSPQTKVTTTVQSQPGKTLWDLLQLLVIPLMLAIGGFWFNQIQKDREQRAIDERAEREKRETEQRDKTEREIAADNQREIALQAYLDKMSELLLEKKLRDSTEEDEIRKVARVRTLTVLRGLDPIRKASVIQFLHESGLIDKDKCIISLNGANLSEANLGSSRLRDATGKRHLARVPQMYNIDLSRADLSHANLRGAVLYETILNGANLCEAILHRANLSGAFLMDADLTRADLCEADLSGARLTGADLRGADLRGAYLAIADLRGANLSSANITEEQLKRVSSLKGATMPDGSKHP